MSELQSMNASDRGTGSGDKKDLGSVIAVPALVFVLGLMVSIAIGWHWSTRNDAAISAEVLRLTNQAEQLVRSRFGLYEYGLRGMRGVVVTAGPQELDRTDVENYIATRENNREFPGARGFGFVKQLAFRS